jgi:hypothetical protein
MPKFTDQMDALKWRLLCMMLDNGELYVGVENVTNRLNSAMEFTEADDLTDAMVAYLHRENPEGIPSEWRELVNTLESK